MSEQSRLFYCLFGGFPGYAGFWRYDTRNSGSDNSPGKELGLYLAFAGDIHGIADGCVFWLADD